MGAGADRTEYDSPFEKSAGSAALSRLTLYFVPKVYLSHLFLCDSSRFVVFVILAHAHTLDQSKSTQIPSLNYVLHRTRRT